MRIPHIKDLTLSCNSNRVQNRFHPYLRLQIHPPWGCYYNYLLICNHKFISACRYKEAQITKKIFRLIAVVLILLFAGAVIKNHIGTKESTEFERGNATASSLESIESIISDELRKELNLDENDPLQKAVLDSIDVVVEKLDGNIARCTFSNIDVASVLDYITEHGKEISSRADFTEVLNDAVKAAPRVESDVNISLKQGVDGNFHVSFSADQLDAATGFLAKYYSKIMGNAQS